MPTAEGVVDLMKRTQSALKAEGQIRLHKITSNSPDVMRAFPQEDLGKELKTRDWEGFLTRPAEFGACLGPTYGLVLVRYTGLRQTLYS